MKIRSYLYFLLCSFFFNLGAEVSLTYINGFDDIFAYEINPTVGAVLWKTKSIQNLYYVTNGEDDQFANSAIGKLVHRLFYLQHDNVSFDCTANVGSIETYGNEKMAAYALAFIMRERAFLNKENKDFFIEKLQKTLVNSFDQKSLISSFINNFQKQMKSFNTRKKALNEEFNKSNTSQLRKDEIQKHLKEIEEIIDKNNKFHEEIIGETTVEKKKKRTLTDIINDKLQELTSSVVYALLESKKPEPLHDADLVNGIFLAWLWRKSEERKSLLEKDVNIYARQYFYDFAKAFNEEYTKNSLFIPKVNDQIKRLEKSLKKTIENPEEKNRKEEEIKKKIENLKKICELKKTEYLKDKDFLDISTEAYKKFVTKAPFTIDDYKNNKATLENLDLSQDFSYEKVAIDYIGYELLASDYPPYINGTSDAVVIINEKRYSFPDCGENAVRNFINCILFNAENRTFDVELLKKISTNQKIIDFYTKYFDILKLELPECYNEWATLCSNISNVRYRDVYCNMEGTGSENQARMLAYFFDIEPESTKQVFTALKDKLEKENIILQFGQCFSAEINPETNEEYAYDDFPPFGAKNVTILKNKKELELKLTWEPDHFLTEFYKKNETTFLDKFQGIRYYPFQSNKDFFLENHDGPLLSFVPFLTTELDVENAIKQLISEKKYKLLPFLYAFFHSDLKKYDTGMYIIKHIINKSSSLDDEVLFDLLSKIIHDLRNNEDEMHILINEILEKMSKNPINDIEKDFFKKTIIPHFENWFMLETFSTLVLTILVKNNDLELSYQNLIDYVSCPRVIGNIHQNMLGNKIEKNVFLDFLEKKIDSKNNNQRFSFKEFYKKIFLESKDFSSLGYCNIFDMVINNKYTFLYKSFYTFLKNYKVAFFALKKELEFYEKKEEYLNTLKDGMEEPKK